jgi:hypothetical protein
LLVCACATLRSGGSDSLSHATVAAHADPLTHARILQLACKVDDRPAVRGAGPDVVCFEEQLSPREHQVQVEITAVGVGAPADGFQFKLRSTATFTPNPGENAEVIARAVEHAGPLDLTELAKFLRIRVDMVNASSKDAELASDQARQKVDERVEEIAELARIGDCHDAMQRAQEYLRNLPADEADGLSARDAYSWYLACDDALFAASH